MTTTPVIWNLTGITQATTASTDLTRNGDKVTLKQLEFRANLYAGTATTSARVILFQWKEFGTSTLPNAGLVLSYATGGGYLNGYYNRDTLRAGTLRILADWRMDINTDAGNVNTTHLLYYKTKKMAKQVNFNAGSTDEVQNGIYMLTCSNVVAGTPAQSPTMLWNSILDFTDA